MGGPSLRQAPPSRGEQALGGTATGLLSQLFQGGSGNFQQNLQQLFGGFTQQPNALQQQTGQTLQQLIDPNRQSAAQRTFNIALPQIQGQLEGGFGQDILGVAQPIFQRNLQQGADVLRQSGPRFASTTERLVGQQSERALQDFNLFQQNVLESGRGRQLEALDVLGRLGQGADASQLGPLQLAAQFGLGQQQIGQQGQGLQAGFLQQLLQALFQGGGLTQAPTFVQQPSTLGQIASIGGTVGGIAAGVGG